MSGPFGVELPDNIGSSEPAAAPETSSEPTQDLEVSSKADTPETTEESQVLDLDKLERFRFAGKEWSPKDLHNAYLMREDYTRKTQELSEARKFAENFEADLGAVVENPSLFQKFRSVYPKFYVDLAERLLNSQMRRESPANSYEGRTPEKNAATNDPLTQRLGSIEQEFAEWKKAQYQTEVEKAQSWLDNQYSTLAKKYPEADPEVVTARAEVLARQGTQLTDKVLDKLFQQHHTQVSERFGKRYKEKVTQQVSIGNRSKDMAAGGGIPSDPPRTPKTIKEATEMAIADLSRR